jgi:chromosome segregation ATPase
VKRLKAGGSVSLSPERLAANETAIWQDGRDLLAENERLREALAACDEDHEATTKRLRERRDENERLRAALRVAGKHLEDCCRTDIGWQEQMRSHDKAVRALADRRGEA